MKRIRRKKCDDRNKETTFPISSHLWYYFQQTWSWNTVGCDNATSTDLITYSSLAYVIFTFITQSSYF